jgi:antitoxin FitA
VAQLIIRNFENATKARLQRQARRNGRSLEDEIREILGRAVQEKSLTNGGLGSEIAGLFTKIGFVADILELRGCAIKPFVLKSR